MMRERATAVLTLRANRMILRAIASISRGDVSWPGVTFLAPFGLIGLRLVELYGIDQQAFARQVDIASTELPGARTWLRSALPEAAFARAAEIIPDPAFALRSAECSPPRTSARSAAAGCQAVHCTRRWGAWRGMHGSSGSACPVAAATWPMDSGFPAHVCFASHFLVPLLGLNCRTARVRRGTGVLWSTDLPANPAAKASFAWRRTRTTDP